MCTSSLFCGFILSWQLDDERPQPFFIQWKTSSQKNTLLGQEGTGGETGRTKEREARNERRKSETIRISVGELIAMVSWYKIKSIWCWMCVFSFTLSNSLNLKNKNKKKNNNNLNLKQFIQVLVQSQVWKPAWGSSRPLIRYV